MFHPLLKTLLFLFCLFTLSSCSHRGRELVSIQLTDQSGLKETFSSPDRLSHYKNTDFLYPQPYTQVLRVYKNTEEADTESFLTSYYPNGQIQKYLEIRNTQAHGWYQEWYYTGETKVKAYVIGGTPDFSSHSESSWLFDGLSQAWDKEGNLLADINYRMGRLEGPSLTYHSNGKLWKKSNYRNGLLHGKFLTYTSDGKLLTVQSYQKGLKHGPSLKYWSNKKKAAEELFIQGSLETANYYSPNEKLIASVKEGNGFSARFRKNSLYSLQEVQSGRFNGLVKVYDSQNKLEQSYYLENDLKEGEEILYYPDQRKKISIPWKEGVISGTVKTWYPDGMQESQREMHKGKKSGILTAWYQDGSTMLVEKYHQDKLAEGSYFYKGSLQPKSSIYSGNGIATLFDADGTFLREVIYQGGEPLTE